MDVTMNTTNNCVNIAALIKRVRPITLLRLISSLSWKKASGPLRYYGSYHRCLAKKRWPITLLRYYGKYQRCLAKKGSAHYVITLLRLISSLSWEKAFGPLRYYGSYHRCLAKKRWPITLLRYYGKYHRCLAKKGWPITLLRLILSLSCWYHLLISSYHIIAVLRKSVGPLRYYGSYHRCLSKNVGPLRYYVMTANIIAVLRKKVGPLRYYVITADIFALLRKSVRPITLLRLISSLSCEKSLAHYVITANISAVLRKKVGPLRYYVITAHIAVLRKRVRPITLLRYYGWYLRCLEKNGSAHCVFTLLRLKSSLNFLELIMNFLITLFKRNNKKEAKC